MRWYIGVALLLLAALVIDSGLLAYATYVLFALLILSRALASGWMGGLRATRVCILVKEDSTEKQIQGQDIHVEIGDVIIIRIHIENEGLLPVPWVLLEDMLPAAAVDSRNPHLQVKGRRTQVVMIGSKGKYILRYQLECRKRGCYQLGPLVMENGDLWGLHRRYKLVTQPEYLLVYPKIVPLEDYEIASKRPIGDVTITHRIYEDPTRIAGVRAYEPGDPMNRVHWGATARTGELHCKITEPSMLTGATIVLSFHEEEYHSRGEPFRSELAVTTASSLANAVLETGQQVGLVTNGRDAADRLRLETWEAEHATRSAAHQSTEMLQDSDRLRPMVVETRRGAEQLQHIREVLARAELTDGLTFAQLLEETLGRIPRDATLLVVLGNVSLQSALTLGSLRRRGFAIAVVLIRLDDERLEKAYAHLIAEGIRDVRHLRSEDELPALCRNQLQRSSPYQMVTF